jgi:hypothetical protein
MGLFLTFCDGHHIRRSYGAAILALKEPPRERTMSDEFRSVDAREKAALEAALKKCCVLADRIDSILRIERRDFVDKVSLAEFCAALERAADVLGQESRIPVENTPAPAVMGSRARGHQRHR